MNIVLAASEAFPFCKTGGLADVVGALTQNFARVNKTQVVLFIPYYRAVRNVASLQAVPGSFYVPVNNRLEQAKLFYIKWGRALVFFVSCPKYFDRAGLYNEQDKDYADNDERFIFFSRAVLEGCKFIGLKPHIIHAHDWQTGLIPAYLETVYKSDAFFTRTHSVFTIHNIAYQGCFPAETFNKAGFYAPDFTPEKFEYWGGISFLKSGIVFANKVTTVSPNYASELLSARNSFGLEGVLRDKGEDFSGIINGLDTDVWDPKNDALLTTSYDEDSLKGKLLCKVTLQKELGLAVDENKPLCVMVSRLSQQKGVDLVADLIPLMADKAQFIIVGKGDPRAEEMLSSMSQRNPRNFAFRAVVDETLAHKVYSAGDIFLMPSRFEPCGLSQMISMRYGTIPVVSKTGGLVDTVKGLHSAESLINATGFFIDGFDTNGLINTMKRVLHIYSQKEAWLRLIENGMLGDYSWQYSAEKYLELYVELTKQGQKWQ